MDDSKKGLLRFGFNTLASMYHLATAKVCVLDAYWPVVSMLRHKKGLTVIQMWHALGKIKQSGYQTLDKESGRSKELSHLLCMHKNYDYIIAGGKARNPYYVASFGTTEDKLVNIRSV
jgi:CDP-ribitol ribitolphosphotransferase